MAKKKTDSNNSTPPEILDLTTLLFGSEEDVSSPESSEVSPPQKRGRKKGQKNTSTLTTKKESKAKASPAKSKEKPQILATNTNPQANIGNHTSSNTDLDSQANTNPATQNQVEAKVSTENPVQANSTAKKKRSVLKHYPIQNRRVLTEKGLITSTNRYQKTLPDGSKKPFPKKDSYHEDLENRNSLVALERNLSEEEKALILEDLEDFARNPVYIARPALSVPVAPPSDDFKPLPQSEYNAVKELTAHLDKEEVESLDTSDLQLNTSDNSKEDQDHFGGCFPYPDIIYSEESLKVASPMMRQYLEIKAQHKDKILFFRMGDFYEFFFDDAIITARELNIALSTRQNHLDFVVPMAGIPFHAYEAYAAKLVGKGYSIAICEQTSNPKAKGLTKRDVVRIFTPGTLSEDNYLPARDSKPLCSVFTDYLNYGIALVDVSSGYVEVSTLDNYQDFQNRLNQYNPAEIIYADKSLLPSTIQENFYCKEVKADYFYTRSATDNVKAVFGTEELIRFASVRHCIPALGALIRYVQETQMVLPEHFQTIHFAHEDSLVALDAATIHNLELFHSNSGNKSSAFVEVLDKCSTSMGSRLFRRWVRQPVRSPEVLKQRLDFVTIFKGANRQRQKLMQVLKNMSDLERIVSRIALGNASPKDLGEMRNNLKLVPYINQIFNEGKLEIDHLDELKPIRELLLAALNDKQPNYLREGGVIRSSFNKDLKELRALKENVLTVLEQMEQVEREKTGIETLSIKLNNQNEMFIHIPRGNNNLELVPDHYIHTKSLKQASRFTTKELRDLELKFAHSDTQITELEKEIFNQICLALKSELKHLQNLANQLARLDVYLSFAQLAFEQNYVRPEFNFDGVLEIQKGRHPVIEKLQSKPFIPNNSLATPDQNLAIITGPNMGGKSTYMRQNALISIMALMGSYVPAEYANIPLFDKILTRIGASDDISTGKSTFMVEMSEMAYILANATAHSLLLIDEIGRGTSTFDGLSLAWACAQYIAQESHAITFFSTHYFELTVMSQQLENVFNLYVSAIEHDDEISFLHEIKEGIADKSYGIEVAKLAGLPMPVISIAQSQQMQFQAEQERLRKAAAESPDPDYLNFSLHNPQGMKVVDIDYQAYAQPAKSPEEEEVLKLLAQVNPNELTPLQSLELLSKLKDKLKA